MLSGDNGILQKATDAKTRTERASVIEQARTDVLGYQAENKGGDLQKSQLKSVLNTYFKDVPSVLPNGNTLLDLQLTTLDKYGTHTIKVSEIYSGTITEGPKVKASTLFEDKAGDEEGATVGKIHIGDYVNYNPISNEDTGNESKYKYSSSNDYTGITEAISSSKLTGFSDSSQNFVAKSNLKWQIIGIDGNNILITSENPIISENPVSIQVQTGPSSYETHTGYYLYGAKAYVNVNQNSGERNEINNISKIYGNGKGADSNKTRGITIEDINYITGVTANGTTLTPAEIYTAPTGYEYGTTVTDYNKGENTGWTPEAWLSASTTDRDDSTKSPGISEKITGYQYEGSNMTLKTANSAIRYNLIFGESSNKKYWLATRAVGVFSFGAYFGPGCVTTGKACSYSSNFGYKHSESGFAFGIRPIIYLDSNVSLTSTGTTNNVTTWDLD